MRRMYGTESRPRLRVYRSLRYLYSQLIDDERGKTLVSASSFEVKSQSKNPTEIAKIVGELLGKRAKEKKISLCIFDRGRFAYHGQVKAFAEGARRTLKF